MTAGDPGIARMMRLLTQAGCTKSEIAAYGWRLAQRHMTLEEIGAQLGISGAMVHRRLSAARVRLERLAAGGDHGEDLVEELDDVESVPRLSSRALVEHLVREDIEERHQVTGVAWWRPATLRKSGGA